MTKTPENKGKLWTQKEIQQLQDLVNKNTPTRIIALKLGRTENSIRSKASEENISLKPTNQSPYNRQK